MSTVVNRKSILRGPCQIQYGTTPIIFYSKDDVVVQFNMKTQNILSSALGLVDYRDDDLNATITFTPDGQVTAGLLAALYPYLQSGIYPGASVFGTTDTALTIWTRTGEKYIFNNAAVTKQPQFIASASKTAFGQVTFTALRAMGAQWSDANSLFSQTSATYPGDSTFNLSNILTAPFAPRWYTGTVPSGSITATSDANPDVITTAAAHGLNVNDAITIAGALGDTAINGNFFVKTAPTSTTLTISATQGGSAIAGAGTYTSGGTFIRANAFDYFDTESGFAIDTNVTLEGDRTGMSDSQGMIDMTFQQMEVTAKATPIGPMPSDLLTAFGIQGGSAVRGRSRAATGANLYLVGSGIYAKMTQAAITDIAPIRAGMATKRVGEVTWKSTMTLASGVPQAPLQLSTSPIT